MEITDTKSSAFDQYFDVLNSLMLNLRQSRLESVIKSEYYNSKITEFEENAEFPTKKRFWPCLKSMDGKRRDKDDIPLVSDKEKIIFGKKLSWKSSNALFQNTRAILRNQISPNWRFVSKQIFKKTIRRFLFETLSDVEDHVEDDTLTQFLNL